jgi:glycine/D-amino acid oxidase-like deaminating enzyme
VGGGCRRATGAGQEWRSAAGLGYQARWLDLEEVCSLEPDMAADMIGSRVAYFPDEGWVDPARLIAALS